MSWFQWLLGGGDASAGTPPRWPPEGAIQVVLDDAGPRKISTIKAIRELTHLGLAEAKELSERTPSVVYATDDSDRAVKAAELLREAGAQVRIAESEGTASALPEGTASVRLVSVGAQKIAVIKALRTHLRCGLAEAKQMADTAPTVVVRAWPQERALALMLDLTDAGAQAEVDG